MILFKILLNHCIAMWLGSESLWAMPLAYGLQKTGLRAVLGSQIQRYITEAPCSHMQQLWEDKRALQQSETVAQCVGPGHSEMAHWACETLSTSGQAGLFGSQPAKQVRGRRTGSSETVVSRRP